MKIQDRCKIQKIAKAEVIVCKVEGAEIRIYEESRDEQLQKCTDIIIVNDRNYDGTLNWAEKPKISKLRHIRLKKKN